MKIAGRFDAVMDAPAFEGLDPGQRQTPRLKRAYAGRDHHGPGLKTRAQRGCHVKFAVRQRLQLGDLLAQMERRMERFCLFQQPIDQFLSAANRQRGDIVDRFVRIQLGALPADLGQRIDDVRLDSEQTEFENLK